jgi:hypothetical protein
LKKEGLAMTMMIDADLDKVLDALSECIDWKLRPALDSQEFFDELVSELRRRFPAFRNMAIADIDLALADARRRFENDVREAQWQMYSAFRVMIGGEDV